MKIKKGFVLRKLKDQNLVVAVGEAAKSFHGMIRLNETGAFLWEELKEEKTKADLVQCLMEAYEIDETRAKNGVEKFLMLLKDVECIDGTK